MQFEYSIFWLLAVVIVSAGISILFYRRDKSIKNAPRFVRTLLIVLRSVMLFTLGLLLLKPFVKSEVAEIQKPVFLCLHDNSRSILASSTDTAFLQNQYPQQYQQFCDEVGEMYEVEQLVFGNSVHKSDTLQFSDSETDYSSLFGTLQDLYSDVNIGGIVLATDGNHTRGEALMYAARRLQTAAPIYTVLLGDSVKKTDARIAHVQYNEHAYLNKTSQIVADVQWNGVSQKEMQLRLWANDSLVVNRKIELRSSTGQVNEILNFTPLKTGLCAMRIEVSGITDDKIAENNSQLFYVTVLASKKKIALYSKGISPDAGAIYRALQGNGNFELEYVDNLSASFAQKCDMLVLFGGDSDGSVTRFTDKYAKPLLWLRGNADFQSGAYTSSVNVQSSGESFNSVSLIKNQTFSAFSLSQQLQELSAESMPLNVPFGEYSLPDARTQIAAYQKIKSIETKYPLVTVSQSNKSKQVHLLGSGYWQWRMQCFITNANFFVFDEFINTIAEFLLANSGEKRFVVRHPAIVSESEPIRFAAQVMDQSMQLTVDADVTLSLQKEGGTGTVYEFTPSQQRYDLLVGHLPAGVYQYNAKAQLSNETLSYSGVIQITESNSELLFSSADMQAVSMLYDEHNGEIYRFHDRDKLIDLIESDPAKPVYVSTTEFLELIDLIAVFAFICFLLFGEWVLRKYYGGF